MVDKKFVTVVIFVVFLKTHCCIFCLMSEILSNRSVKYFGGAGSRDPALDLNHIRLPMTFIYVEYMMMQ